MTIERLKQLLGEMVITQTELVDQISALSTAQDVLAKELKEKNALIEKLNAEQEVKP